MMFKFSFILWVYDNFSFPHKVHFADRSLPVPQCSKTGILLYWPVPFLSFLFLISDSGRIRNDGFPNKTIAGKGDSFLWDSQKNAGQCGGTICFLPSALGLGGICLKSPGSCSEDRSLASPLAQNALGPGSSKCGPWTSHVIITGALVRNAESWASLALLSQNLHLKQIPSDFRCTEV